MKRIAIAALSVIALGVVIAFAQQVVPPADTINCAYNASPPTVTSGQMVRVQCDSSGTLLTSGGGGGGGAVTIADGADVAEGATADAASTAGGTGTVSAKLRLVTTQLNTISSNTAGPIPVPTTSTGALTGVSCGSAVSSCVLKSSTGNFFGVYAECTSACWLMVFNATSAPSNGATTAGVGSGNLVECIDIGAASSKSITYPTFPRNYTVGITVAISSTACASLTLSTVGFVSGSVM